MRLAILGNGFLADIIVEAAKKECCLTMNW